eukprot:TRINITY_DN19576_c0_g1_i1.p1 TRINITY_DN19576_c0_g1~~TRINITY_DN19576_c0_g1_i1.p1  ORF type:complete len:331 (-),score=48.87 TRINITY_DN19576_c0_g1_i1:52-1044(-)
MATAMVLNFWRERSDRDLALAISTSQATPAFARSPITGLAVAPARPSMAAVPALPRSPPSQVALASVQPFAARVKDLGEPGENPIGQPRLRTNTRDRIMGFAARSYQQFIDMPRRKRPRCGKRIKVRLAQAKAAAAELDSRAVVVAAERAEEPSVQQLLVDVLRVPVVEAMEPASPPAGLLGAPQPIDDQDGREGAAWRPATAISAAAVSSRAPSESSRSPSSFKLSGNLFFEQPSEDPRASAARELARAGQSNLLALRPSLGQPLQSRLRPLQPLPPPRERAPALPARAAAAASTRRQLAVEDAHIKERPAYNSSCISPVVGGRSLFTK